MEETRRGSVSCTPPIPSSIRFKNSAPGMESTKRRGGLDWMTLMAKLMSPFVRRGTSFPSLGQKPIRGIRPAPDRPTDDRFLFPAPAPSHFALERPKS